MDKILFIGNGFHNYDKFIVQELKKTFEVLYICSDNIRHKYPILNLYCHLVKSKQRNVAENVALKELQVLKSDYDLKKIFIIKGAYLTESFFCELKEKFPNARIYVYFWDARLLIYNHEVIEKYADVIYSFDSEDCKMYGYKLRPLFYIDDVAYNSNSLREYDVCFVGGKHSNRFESMKIIKNILDANGYSYFISVKFGRIEKLLYILFHHSDYCKYRDIITSKDVPYSQYLNIMGKSKVVIDIHHPKQAGLTMRTIEALAHGMRVITTNPHIREYEDIPQLMYDVVDFSNIKSDYVVQFLSAKVEYFHIPSRYRLDKFLEEIIKSN